MQFRQLYGSVPTGQALYTTSNGGIKWIRDTLDPANPYVITLETKGKQVAMADYKHFYHSNDKGVSFPVSDKIPNHSSPKRYLQFEDSNYAILSSDNIIDVLVKRPGTNGWIDEHAPPGTDNGAITAIVLDGNECWITEAFDTNKLYYSSDSAKTFTSTIPLTNSSFQYLTKARKGRTLIGGTPSFMAGKIYINTRTVTASEQQISKSKTVLKADQ